MINQFRTLLMNLSDQGDPQEFISPNFPAKNLPKELADIYSLLFPTGASRTYKNFLANCYLNLVKAAGMQSYVTAVDDRITYDLEADFSFFKFYRTSNPITSSPVTLFINGTYVSNLENDDYYDHFLVRQVADSLRVGVESTTNGRVYWAGDLVFEERGNTGSSQVIKLAGTNLSISFNAPSDFTSRTGQTWEFTAEAPYAFNFNTIFSSI